MMRNKVLMCLVGAAALASSLCAASVPAPAPSFTISAGNVTMPSSGMVSIPFTLTSVNGFVGSVAIQCVPPTVSAGVKAPFCEDYGPVQAYPLTAGGTATGTFAIVAIPPKLVPVVSGRNRVRPSGGASWALAGVLLLGIGLQRKRTRRFARALLAIGVMGVTGMSVSGCGGPPTLTPGAYVFTVNANSVLGTLGLSASATSTVTVPAGIVTSTSD